MDYICDCSTMTATCLNLQFFHQTLLIRWASLVNQMVKNLSAMQETWIPPLGRENPLEKGMATHCSILAGQIPWTEEPGGLQSVGSQRVGHYWEINTFNGKVICSYFIRPWVSSTMSDVLQMHSLIQKFNWTDLNPTQAYRANFLWSLSVRGFNRWN